MSHGYSIDHGMPRLYDFPEQWIIIIEDLNKPLNFKDLVKPFDLFGITIIILSVERSGSLHGHNTWRIRFKQVIL